MTYKRPRDKIFDELTEFGLKLPRHTIDLVGSNLSGDKHYDEIALFQTRTKENCTGRIALFDLAKTSFKIYGIHHLTEIWIIFSTI